MTWALAQSPQYGWREGLLALREEVAKPAYGGQTDAQIAATLNAQTTTITVGLSREDALARLIRADVWGNIVMRANVPRSGTAATNIPIRAAIQVRDAFLQFATFDLSDPLLYAALDRDLALLVTAGDVPANVRTAILATRDKATPVWQPAVTPQDVALARSLKDG